MHMWKMLDLTLKKYYRGTIFKPVALCDPALEALTGLHETRHENILHKRLPFPPHPHPVPSPPPRRSYTEMLCSTVKLVHTLLKLIQYFFPFF